MVIIVIQSFGCMYDIMVGPCWCGRGCNRLIKYCLIVKQESLVGTGLFIGLKYCKKLDHKNLKHLFDNNISKGKDFKYYFRL